MRDPEKPGKAVRRAVHEEFRRFRSAARAINRSVGSVALSPMPFPGKAPMMLEWLGRGNGVAEAMRAGALIRQAVDSAFAHWRADV